jgi:hypothetical protein
MYALVECIYLDVSTSSHNQSHQLLPMPESKPATVIPLVKDVLQLEKAISTYYWIAMKLECTLRFILKRRNLFDLRMERKGIVMTLVKRVSTILM